MKKYKLAYDHDGNIIKIWQKPKEMRFSELRNAEGVYEIHIDLPDWADIKRYLTDSQYEDSVDSIMLYSNHPDDPRLEKLIGLSDKEIQKALRALGHKVYKIK